MRIHSSWDEAQLVSEPKDETQPVPRHKEIKEYLARHIIKMLRDET